MILKKNILILFSIIILANTLACKQNKKSADNENAVNQFGGTPLFDGKTLDGWEVTNFGTQGPVQVTNGQIVMGMGDGLTGITWQGGFPKMNYEIGVDAMKVSGNDFFCGITFPFDTTYCSFIVGGWGGPVVGLSTIDGRDASENATKTLMHFKKNVWYNIRLQVTHEKIEGWIDDEKVVDFSTKGHNIYIRPEVSLSRPFGIASWTTSAAIKNIWLKKIEHSGQSDDQIRASE